MEKKKNPTRVCPQCSKVFEIFDIRDQRKQRFCSKKCQKKFNYNLKKETFGRPYMIWVPKDLWKRVKKLNIQLNGEEDKHHRDKYRTTMLAIIKEGLEGLENG